jgi:aerobic-type carbon monoxide dehydrogenase small subunit (CoxS/CutS family)
VRLLHQRYDHGGGSLLAANKGKEPSAVEIKQALAKNLCRCGTHARIVRAIQRV